MNNSCLQSRGLVSSSTQKCETELVIFIPNINNATIISMCCKLTTNALNLKKDSEFKRSQTDVMFKKEMHPKAQVKDSH